MGRCLVGGSLSTTQLSCLSLWGGRGGVGVEPGVCLVGWWLFRTHCWVLKDQAPLLEGVGVSGCPSFACPGCLWPGWGLVGLLFEICIVDASI